MYRDSQILAVRMRNRAYDHVYVQNNARHLRFTGTSDWFGEAQAYAGDDRAIFPLVRVDATARRSLNRLARHVRCERATLLPAVAQSILTSSDDTLVNRLMTRIDGAAGRRRLARLWRAPAARRRDVATGILSRLFEDRWRAADAAGFASPLDASRVEDHTLPGADDLRAFVTRYAREASARSQLLVEAVGAGGVEGAEAMLDYPYYLWERAGRCLPVHLDLTRSIELARLLLELCLDCSVEVIWSPETVLLSLRDHEGHVPGHIQVDLCAAARTACAESPVSRAGDTVGRVLVRHVSSANGCTMTYESFFLFMHEIGHALTHVVRAAGSVYRGPWSGLVYGPVMHSESLSALTEKLALHPDLATYFRLRSPQEAAALRVRQDLTALEFLKSETAQVACARLDCLSMAKAGRSSGRDLDEILSGQGLGSWTDAWQTVPYFLTQLFARHPGAAGVAYLVSNAYSCTLFELFRGRSLEASVRSVATSVAEITWGCRYATLGELEGRAVSAVYLPALMRGDAA